MPAPSQGQTRIAIDQAIIDRIDQIRPQYMDRTTFINFQLDSALTLEGEPASLPSFISSSSSKAVTSNARALSEKLLAEEINHNPDRPAKAKKDPFSSKRISAELVPPELQQHADLIVDFWAIKKGTRSERAWNGLVNKLNGMTPEDQGKALAAAYDGGWATVYEPKADTPAQGKWKQPEPEMKHPAYRDAREIIREQEAQWKEIPSVTGGKGVLEGMF